ncbi:hypothetical protein MesoLjLc_57640 [Mesorhizobium sp. L-8-10]|uniref:putative glycolipid-binding domain-containing protein n=1 Tax=unclassified Mesorhizobium TaxID=325217 RepID=UPI0019264A2A|nr:MULTISPECIES: putative glycolipid-binding domain-containing protein [unclassified Mesorhizobium]BCH25850.1 hypothetical protein MesoLjLb_56350 [Mesorhizobium sp. L-8-3]BCH33834.1 hypothetical protein MesoLjLc_57640 [Mesorhizobium sp. L-8-10]
MTVAAILWERLDVEGHDTCRLSKLADGWRLDGRAVFREGGRPCSLSYEVTCDTGWRTRSALVTGSLGAQDLRFEIAPSGSGGWSLNGIEQLRLAGLIDVDLGFTPATNLLPLNRHALAVGDGTRPSPAVYLEFPEARLDYLEQTYERLGETRYRYTSPAYGYDETLEVSDFGFVTDYPGLWQGKLWLPD